MKKERLKVLAMVEDGKITVEEAAKLLEALSVSNDFCDFDYSEDMEERLNAFSKSVDSFARDFGGKIGETYKSMEPKLRTATKTVVEKTANIVDEISKSLQESLKNLNENGNASEEEPIADDQPREN